MGEPAADVARRGNIKNGKVRLSTVGRLRAEGFRLAKTEPLDDDHYNVDLGEAPTVSIVQRFVGAFDDPTDNPGRWAP